MDQYIGKLLDNRYEILEVVGTGGMAKVYKARCHRLNRLVAIKILREDLSQDAEFRRRFHDESQAVAMLSHPNIMAVYDVSRSSELEYIVMELIDGITLKQYMQKKGNKLNWREALHFITQIVKALGHAHSRGIIHRDIKPHNIMVLRDGSVKVADFGIARLASGGHSTLTQEALGSVHYISPEQARGSHIDARSDLYSTGVVLYEMIAGRLPFEGDTPVAVAIQHINSIPLSPRELDPSIPEALEEITMKAMAPNPANRYRSADEMLADLEEFRKNPNINFDYKLSDFSPEQEPDQDRTQIRAAVPSHGHSRPSREPSRRESYDPPPRSRRSYEENEDDRPRRGPIWPVLLAVAGVLLFVVLVFNFLWKTVFADLLKPADTYQVPSLVGQMLEDVKGNQELLGRFTLVEGGTVTNDAEQGTILEQVPKAGDQVGENVTDITVTVSGGPKIIEMIDITNWDYQDAYRELLNMGLKPTVPTYENDEEVEANHIISFTPYEKTPLSPGTEIHMVVSKGPEKKPFPMPDLREMPKEQALSTIQMHNLVPGRVEGAEVEVYHDTIPAGHVVSQYPAPETEVTEGTEVNLQISQGPDPATQPPEPSGPVTKTIYIDLPPSDGIVRVQVVMDEVLVYDREVNAAMEAQAEVTVSGTGVKTLMIFFNGEQGGTETVDFGQPETP